MNLWSSRKTPLGVGFIVALGALAMGFLTGHDHLEGAKLAARWTSRVGVPIFLIVYLASSLWKIAPNAFTKSLMQTRRQWGLAFAWTHSVHLAALTYYLTIAGMPPDMTTLLGGGAAYALLYLMALTSNNWSMRKLGKNWKRLHSIGIHYIWFIYTLTYFGRLNQPDQWHVGVIAMIAMLLALVFRLTVKFVLTGKKTGSAAQ